jgi:sarcosine oxidase subunit alpha
VLDDGILVCRNAGNYLLHTTSAGAETVYRHLDEWLQCEWPALDVVLTNVTGDWGTFMLAGPALRPLLATVLPDLVLDLPHMGWRESCWRSQPLRLLRASFTGEPGYEVSVPAPLAPALLEALLETGTPAGLTPFGVESLMLLRMEKGFIHLGADTDGTTMPQDLGWRAAVEKKHADFVGRRSVLQQLQSQRQRFEFTGLQPLGGGVIAAGAHVLEADGAHAGFVTSSGYSHTLGKPIALGLVSNGMQRAGDTVTLFDCGQRSLARLCPPCFLDPAGERLLA